MSTQQARIRQDTGMKQALSNLVLTTLLCSGFYATFERLASIVGVDLWGAVENVATVDPEPEPEPEPIGRFTAANSFADAGVAFGEPYQLVDTRSDGSGRLVADEVRFVDVRGAGALPGNVSAITIELTAIDPATAGYVTVWPCASSAEHPPVASLLNFAAGQRRTNSGLVGLGPTGGVCAYSPVSVNIVIDVIGVVKAHSGITPILPYRMFDSRSSTGLVPTGRVERVQVAGRGGIPSDARSIFAVVTTTGSKVDGRVTVWPCDDRSSGTGIASVVDFRGGTASATGVLLRLAADGEACVFVDTDSHVVLDVTAWGPAPGPALD